MSWRTIAALLTIAVVLSVVGTTNVEAKKPPPPDSEPPSDVTDLAIVDHTADTVDLTWTAPGDDGDQGTASLYDLRYRMGEAVTEENWDIAYRTCDEPVPQGAGSTESFEAIGLDESTTYYFALKTRDDAELWSGLSNVVSVSTDEAQSGEWVKEISYIDRDYSTGNVGLWSGMGRYYDEVTEQTRVALALGGGSVPLFLERQDGAWSREEFSESTVTGADTSYAPDGTPRVTAWSAAEEAFVLATKGVSEWSYEVIDDEVKDPNENPGSPPPSLVHDPNTGEPTVAYGGVLGRGRWAKEALRFGRRTGTGWEIDEVEQAPLGDVDLAYDLDGNPSIAYFSDIDDEPVVKFAHWDGSDWQIEIADSGYEKNIGFASVGVSLVYDPITGYPLILHNGSFASHSGLRLVRYTDPDWEVEIVADDWTDYEGPGWSCLGIGADGTPYVGYETAIPIWQRIGNGEAGEQYWVEWFDGSDWQRFWIDRVDGLGACHIELDPVTDQPLFGYIGGHKFAYIK